MNWWQIVVSGVLIFFGHAFTFKSQLQWEHDLEEQRAEGLRAAREQADAYVKRVTEDVDRRVTDYYAQDSAAWRATYRYDLEAKEDMQRMKRHQNYL